MPRCALAFVAALCAATAGGGGGGRAQAQSMDLPGAVGNSNFQQVLQCPPCYLQGEERVARIEGTDCTDPANQVTTVIGNDGTSGIATDFSDDTNYLPATYAMPSFFRLDLDSNVAVTVSTCNPGTSGYGRQTITDSKLFVLGKCGESYGNGYKSSAATRGVCASRSITNDGDGAAAAHELEGLLLGAGSHTIMTAGQANQAVDGVVAPSTFELTVSCTIGAEDAAYQPEEVCGNCLGVTTPVDGTMGDGESTCPVDGNLDDGVDCTQRCNDAFYISTAQPECSGGLLTVPSVSCEPCTVCLSDEGEGYISECTAGGTGTSNSECYCLPGYWGDGGAHNPPQTYERPVDGVCTPCTPVSARAGGTSVTCTSAEETTIVANGQGLRCMDGYFYTDEEIDSCTICGQCDGPGQVMLQDCTAEADAVCSSDVQPAISNVIASGTTQPAGICWDAADWWTKVDEFVEDEAGCTGAGHTYIGCYSVSTIQPAPELYMCDRSYVFDGAVPEYLNGIASIRTANSDKASDRSDTDFLCFEIDAPGTVYVLYDSRAVNLPGWLEHTFTDQHATVAAVTDGVGAYNVYFAGFPAGQVCLGGNFEVSTEEQDAYTACYATSDSWTTECDSIGDPPGEGSMYVVAVGPLLTHSDINLGSDAEFVDPAGTNIAAGDGTVVVADNGVNAIEQCSIQSLFQHLTQVTTDPDCREGCSAPNCANSPDWYPSAADSCSAACGQIYEPFWDECGLMLTDAHMGGMEEMGIFYDHCLEQLYPPGTCGTFCNEHTFQCFATEVQESCCDEGGQNCVAESQIPVRCPVGCALNFPQFLDVCRDHIAQQMPDQLGSFEQFSNSCMEVDGIAIIEYLIDLKHRGCTVDLQSLSDVGEHHRRLQFLMSLIYDQSEACPWDHVDDVAREVDDICCGSPSTCVAAESGSPLLLPTSCSPACAMALHEFNQTCGAVVLAMLGPEPTARKRSLVAFEEQCMDEVEANMGLIVHALDTATCPPNGIADPNLLFWDDFDGDQISSSWEFSQVGPTSEYWVEDGSLHATVHDRTGDGGVGDAVYFQTVQEFSRPLTVEARLARTGTNCVMMQILSPDKSTDRHIGIDYCGSCWAKECISAIEGWGCSDAPSSSSYGVVQGEYYKIRLTIDAQGTVSLYHDFDRGWQLRLSGSSELSSSLTTGHLAFTRQCVDMAVDYVWVKQGVHNPMDEVG